MKALDLIIIFGYLIGIVLFGTWFSRKQKTTADYFLGDRSVPWWAVAFSIVATETSTITFISIPGVAFARGGNFGFLQLVFGYLLGRIVSVYERQIATGEVGAEGRAVAGPAIPPEPSTGLLYGRIQSGKTVAMIALVAASSKIPFGSASTTLRSLTVPAGVLA